MQITEREDDPLEAQMAAQDGHQARMWTALPGIVQSFDAEAQTVTVQPQHIGTQTLLDGTTQQLPMPVLQDVPVMWPRAGGFACTLPVAAGDEVLLVFASRCIDGWWSTGAPQVPPDSRMHDLSDAFAVFAPTSTGRALTDVQTDGIELRNDDRSTFIRVTNGTIFITGNVEHSGNYHQSGDFNRDGNVTTNGNVQTNGSDTVTGPISGMGGMSITGGGGGGGATATITGTLHATGDITAGGISLDTHIHGNGNNGGNTTGPQ